MDGRSFRSRNAHIYMKSTVDNSTMNDNKQASFYERRNSNLSFHSTTDVISIILTDDDEKTIENVEEQTKPFFKRYRWHMAHYFYIHLIIFILNSLIGGLIIYLIENRSSSPNQYMNVSYIDAWFTTMSTICSCGLTTINFAQLSLASQIIMMCFAFVSGFAISTLPALVIKTVIHKNHGDNNTHIDNDQIGQEDSENLTMSNLQRNQELPAFVRSQLALLPTPLKLCYRAYLTCIILIFIIYCIIYIAGFISIGLWLETHNSPEYLSQNNATLNPWYVSSMLTLFSFNQNGLTPFSTNLARYVEDTYLNLVLVALILSGSAFFPIILRNVVVLARRLAPWHHKVIFDYILLNNHRLSTLLFPTLQTRIYFCVSILLYALAIGTAAALDFNSEALAKYPSGIRILIFVFQTINLRFCGFQTFDISLLTTATLLVYILLMATKPQMLCALDESPFEIYWLAIETQMEVDNETKQRQKNILKPLVSPSSDAMPITQVTNLDALPVKHMQKFLRRQSLAIKELTKRELSKPIKDDESSQKQIKRLKTLRIRLFFIHFTRALIKHMFNFFVRTRTWLFVFIFIICALEYCRMAPVDPHITLLKIIFELISAFGGVGMSLGYPDKVTSFSTILSSGSKVILIATMLMGRHRGLLASMKDQEDIEYSAANLLNRWREEYILKHCYSAAGGNTIDVESDDSKITYF